MTNSMTNIQGAVYSPTCLLIAFLDDFFTNISYRGKRLVILCLLVTGASRGDKMKRASHGWVRTMREERSPIEFTVSNLQIQYSRRTHYKFFPSFPIPSLIIYTIHTLLPLCNYSLLVCSLSLSVTGSKPCEKTSFFFHRFLSPILILSEHGKSVPLSLTFALSSLSISLLFSPVLHFQSAFL